MSSNTNQDHFDINREAALQRKAKIEALAQGQIPTTEQLTEGIENMKTSDSLAEAQSQMSPQGQKVVSDAQKLMDTTERILQEKNANDELQSAIYHGVQAGKGHAQAAKDNFDPSDLDSADAQDLAQEAARRAWNVARLTLQSSEFRKLIGDITGILTDAIHASVTGKDEHKAAVGQNIGNDEEVTPREGLNRAGQTARGRTADVYQQATAGAAPIVQGYSAGELSHKEAAQQLVDKATASVKAGVQGITLTDEQQDGLVERIKKILLQAHGSQEYQSALDDFGAIISELINRGQTFTSQMNNAAQQAGTTHQTDLDKAQINAKTLVEKFANGKSLDPLAKDIEAFGRDMRNDPEFRKYINTVGDFLHRSLRDTQFLEQADWRAHARDLVKTGRVFLNERYADQTEQLLDDLDQYKQAFKEDALTNELRADLERLTNSLFMDENGHPTFKFDLLKDFVRVLPIIAARLEYLPIPKIEHSDDEYDVVIDNLVLRCSNIIPRYMRIHTDTEFNMAPPVTHGDKVQDATSISSAGVDMRNRVKLDVSHIRADARDIAFHIRKKSGLIKASDVGLVDIVLPNKGFSLHLEAREARANDKENLFKVDKAQTKINDIKIKPHDTKHDTLYKVLLPLIKKPIVRMIEKQIDQKLLELTYTIDKQIGKAADQAKQLRNQAQAQVDQSTEGQATNAVNRAQQETDPNKWKPMQGSLHSTNNPDLMQPAGQRPGDRAIAGADDNEPWASKQFQTHTVVPATEQQKNV